VRSLLIAAAACAVAAPAVAKAPLVINPDPMTVSGRFELPHAAAPLAGQVRIAAVKLDPSLATSSKRDGSALETAFREAVSRTLLNFGYLAADSGGETVIDVELLPVVVASSEGAKLVTARLKFTASGGQAACIGREVEGRFRVLERQRSGGGRRALAVGAVVGMAFLGSPGGTFMADQFAMASAENQLLNAQRLTGAGEGVAPGFKETDELIHGANAATQLALADYIRQLGADPICRQPGISPS
jgi:hypothetical protein